MHLELAKEEAVEIGHGGSHALHKDCSPSTLISSGLELEEQQYVIHIQLNKYSLIDYSDAVLQLTRQL